MYRAAGNELKAVCLSNFPKNPRNPEVYVPQLRYRLKHVEEQLDVDRLAKVRKTKDKDDEDMRILKKVIPKEIPDLPILVAAVGTKEEQHPPSPEREVQAPESKARFPRVMLQVSE